MNTEERHAQTMSALAMANRKKSARAALRKRVHDGEMPVSTVISVAPEILRTTSSASANSLTIAKILAWQTGWGKVRAEKFLGRLGISPRCELHSLSESRRKMLARRLL